MGTSIIYRIIFFEILILNVFGGCKEHKPITEKQILENSFEVSFWIDIDLRTNNGRGYWFNISDRQSDELPTNEDVQNACIQLGKYNSNKLYVIYHRQFEINDAKAVFKARKLYASEHGMTIVPSVAF